MGLALSLGASDVSSSFNSYEIIKVQIIGIGKIMYTEVQLDYAVDLPHKLQDRYL